MDYVQLNSSIKIQNISNSVNISRLFNLFQASVPLNGLKQQNNIQCNEEIIEKNQCVTKVGQIIVYI